MSQQLGFRVGTTNTFASNTLTGNVVYNSTGDFAVSLLSDICVSEGSKVLADVQDVGLSPPGSIVRFQAQDSKLQTRRFERTGSTAFHFQLISSTTGRPVRTHGLPLVIHLKIFRQETDQIIVQRAQLIEMQKLSKLITEMVSLMKAARDGSEKPIGEEPTQADTGLMGEGGSTSQVLEPPSDEEWEEELPVPDA